MTRRRRCPTSSSRCRAATGILVGKRTGFAYYRDHRLERKILIGVFEQNVRLNNYFDGPFDQLPDNFIEGDTLRQAIIDSDPGLKGKIDRLGHLQTEIPLRHYTLYAVSERGRPVVVPSLCDRPPGAGSGLLSLLRH